MEVIELELKKYLSTTFYDPTPDRLNPDEPPVSERQIPLFYTCEKCSDKLYFSKNDFEKYYRKKQSNLKVEDNVFFDDYIELRNYIAELNKYQECWDCLDFYCPNCYQATMFLFIGDPYLHHGTFGFWIKHLLILKV
jgi:hypothetical protein